MCKSRWDDCEEKIYCETCKEYTTMEWETGSYERLAFSVKDAWFDVYTCFVCKEETSIRRED